MTLNTQDAPELARNINVIRQFGRYDRRLTKREAVELAVQIMASIARNGYEIAALPDRVARCGR